MRAALLVLATAATCCAQSPEDLRSLVRDSLRFLDPAGRSRSADYAFDFRTERSQFDSSGAVKSRSTVAGERTFVDGYGTLRILAKDGNRLPDDEMRRQDDIIRSRIAEIKSLSPEEREARRQKEAQDDAWLTEISDALEFRLAGEESYGGRPVTLVTCSPRPGYSARSMRARVFEKTRGKLWIDKADRELVKTEAETFDTVSVGFGLLGRIGKGTRFRLQRLRLADGNWVLEYQNIHFGARVMLVKWIGQEITTRYSNYRHRTELAQR